eukprot:gene15509-18375_t
MGAPESVCVCMGYDRASAWAVGELDTVLKSDGTAWTPRETGLFYGNLGCTWFDVSFPEHCFPNPDYKPGRYATYCTYTTGWVVGEHAIIAKTEDDGATWNEQSNFDFSKEPWLTATFHTVTLRAVQVTPRTVTLRAVQVTPRTVTLRAVQVTPRTVTLQAVQVTPRTVTLRAVQVVEDVFLIDARKGHEGGHFSVLEVGDLWGSQGALTGTSFYSSGVRSGEVILEGTNHIGTSISALV